jgi:hypothetical protein
MNALFGRWWIIASGSMDSLLEPCCFFFGITNACLIGQPKMGVQALFLGERLRKEQGAGSNSDVKSRSLAGPHCRNAGLRISSRVVAGPSASSRGQSY